MSAEQIMEACSPVFAAFCDVATVKWDQYAMALSDVNPGDLDEALSDLRRTHAFRNPPLPADVLRRAEEARKRRGTPSKPEPRIGANDGVLMTHTIKGIGTLKIRVLSDEHPALKRYACLRCKDSGWQEIDAKPGHQMRVARCGCVARNPVMEQQRHSDHERRIARVAR